jgi:hypothetical protein
MDEFKFDGNELKTMLLRLSPYQQIAFAAACCERMLPNYAAFSKMEKWGNTTFLRSALDEVWGLIEKNRCDKQTIQRHVNQCESIVPDTEEFSSIYTSPALDAANAIIETLECCLSHDTAKIVDVAGFARDTVDMYIQDKENIERFDAQVEQQILSHPLMVREMKQQREDLHFLIETPILDGKSLQSYRKASDGKSNIDVA